MKILIAIDETLLLKVLELRLSKDGHDVTTVRNGKKALESIVMQVPHLIIADSCMPHISGIQLLEELKSKSSTQNIPIYILTDNRKEKLMKYALDLGAEDLISIPFNPDEISDKISKHVRWN